MIIQAIILSLQITAIYIVFQQGMLLGWLRIGAANLLDDSFGFCCKKMNIDSPLLTGKKLSLYIQKPLWECLMCMSSVWTIVLTHSFNIKLILLVCGINSLIDKFLDYETKVGG